jgi:hypothetical protein
MPKGLCQRRYAGAPAAVQLPASLSLPPEISHCGSSGLDRFEVIPHKEIRKALEVCDASKAFSCFGNFFPSPHGGGLSHSHVILPPHVILRERLYATEGSPPPQRKHTIPHPSPNKCPPAVQLRELQAHPSRSQKNRHPHRSDRQNGRDISCSTRSQTAASEGS